MNNIFQLSEIEIEKLENLLANSTVVESTTIEMMTETACGNTCQGSCYGSCSGDCAGSCSGDCSGRSS